MCVGGGLFVHGLLLRKSCSWILLHMSCKMHCNAHLFPGSVQRVFQRGSSRCQGSPTDVLRSPEEDAAAVSWEEKKKKNQHWHHFNVQQKKWPPVGKRGRCEGEKHWSATYGCARSGPRSWRTGGGGEDWRGGDFCCSRGERRGSGLVAATLAAALLAGELATADNNLRLRLAHISLIIGPFSTATRVIHARQRGGPSPEAAFRCVNPNRVVCLCDAFKGQSLAWQMSAARWLQERAGMEQFGSFWGPWLR